MPTLHHIDDQRFRELLDKWHKGHFTRSDEQEMEVLTRHDEFRREAWLGLLAHAETNHEQQISRLASRLREQSGVAQRVTMWPQFMAAAAGIALLAIAIWFWQTGPVQNDSQAIAQQTTPAPSTTVEPIVSQPDESLAYEETDRRRDKTPAPQHPTQAAEIQRGASDYATSSSSSSDEVAALERQPAPEPAPTKPTVYTAPGTSSPLKEEKNAAEGAARDVVVTDDESIDKAAGNSYPAAPAKAKSKSRDTKDAMKKSSPPPSAPSIGWEALQRELARTARLPEAARQNNISGSVRVKITLDKNGLPIDYQVVKSLGYGCDEEALRVLKNITTTWIRGANADVMVDVPFIR